MDSTATLCVLKSKFSIDSSLVSSKTGSLSPATIVSATSALSEHPVKNNATKTTNNKLIIFTDD